MRMFVTLLLLLASYPALATPPLFKATHPERPGTLLLAGTVHFLERKEDAIPAAYDRALEKADRVWFELDLTQPQDQIVQTMVQLASDEKDGTLAALRNSGSTDELLAAGEAAGFPVAPLEGFEPWFAMLQWNAVQMHRMGFDPANGVEQQYLARAQSRDKEILGLETVAQQVGYFDALENDTQLAMLQQFLDEREDSRDTLREMVSAWRQGDDAALAALVEEGWKHDPAVAESLLFARNADWANTLDAATTTGKTELVMVGAAHLVGERSLPEQLEKLGWTVERIRE